MSKSFIALVLSMLVWTIILVSLKLMGAIGWPWGWVLTPLWALLGLYVACALLVLAIVAIRRARFKKRVAESEKKRRAAWEQRMSEARNSNQ